MILRCVCLCVCVFQNKVEMLRDSLFSVPCEALAAQLEALVEQTEDFTDSAYTSHEQRETILQLCHTTRQETQQLITAWSQAVWYIIIIKTYNILHTPCLCTFLLYTVHYHYVVQARVSFLLICSCLFWHLHTPYGPLTLCGFVNNLIIKRIIHR